MSTASDCIFCRILAGAIPATIIFENDSVFSFLDIGPLAEGHVLVIPRVHVEHVSDLPADVSAAIGSVIPKLARAVVKATGAEGVNVLANQGAAAGQVVPHVHFHLIPRRTGDGLGYRWNAGKYPEGRAQMIAQAVRDAV